MTYEELKNALEEINRVIKYSVEELNDPYPNVWETALYTCKEALEKAERYKWHDLRENPEDLPDSRYAVMAYDDCDYGTAYYSMQGYVGWVTSDKDVDEEEIVAWRYIEPFEEE